MHLMSKGAMMFKAQSKPQKPWLVMLYMAGDNNLTEDMVLALQDLKAEEPLNGDKIVAQFDPSGIGLSAQRYDFSTPKGPTLEAYRDKTFNPGEINTGSREALVDFITWANGNGEQEEGKKKEYQYLLILAGHGSGATEDFLMKDDASKDSLTIDEFRDALKEAKEKIFKKKIDVLGMDACYMSMGEVAYEIRDYVDIMVGAEGLEPAFGWPYRRILARAKAFLGDTAKNPTRRHMEPQELAKAIVEEYVEHYADYDRSAGRSVDLAAMNLEQTENIKNAFAELVKALPKLDDKAGHEKLLLAHWYAQTYKHDQFVDLTDLCEQVKDQFGEHSEIGRRCGDVTEAIVGAHPCIIKSGCSGFACQYSRGLSIYFPWAAVSPDYHQNLAFARETGWREFLQTHVKTTRRAPRYQVPAYLPTDPVARRKALEDLLTRAKQAPRSPESVSEVERAILSRLKGLRSLRPAALDEALNRVAQTDALAEDYPREITRRVTRAGGLRDLESRYSNHTRYSDHTRSLDDREKAVKNLPPAIGKAYWP
jgi:hypothetical protein